MWLSLRCDVSLFFTVFHCFSLFFHHSVTVSINFVTFSITVLIIVTFFQVCSLLMFDKHRRAGIDEHRLPGLNHGGLGGDQQHGENGVDPVGLQGVGLNASLLELSGMNATYPAIRSGPDGEGNVYACLTSSTTPGTSTTRMHIIGHGVQNSRQGLFPCEVSHTVGERLQP